MSYVKKLIPHTLQPNTSSNSTASDQRTACALASSSALSRVEGGDSFMSAITKAVEDMFKEREAKLAKAKKELKEREDKVDKVLKALDTTNAPTIKFRVGARLYHIPASVLSSQPDSWFTALLRQKDNFADGQEGEVVIPRDERAFEYVLEFLNYGALFTPIPKHIRQMLLQDAEFFGLDKLKTVLMKEKKDEDSEEEEEEKEEEKDGASRDSAYPLAKFSSGLACSQGQNINWHNIIRCPHRFFNQNRSDTVTILRTGLYDVRVRVMMQAADHNTISNHIELRVNGAAIARTANGSGNGYYQAAIADIFELERGAELTVFYNNSYSSCADPLSCQFTIRKLASVSNYYTRIGLS